MNKTRCLNKIAEILIKRLSAEYRNEKSFKEICEQIYAMFLHDREYKGFKDINKELAAVENYMYTRKFHVTKDDFGNLAVAKIDVADII